MRTTRSRLGTSLRMFVAVQFGEGREVCVRGFPLVLEALKKASSLHRVAALLQYPAQFQLRKH